MNDRKQRTSSNGDAGNEAESWYSIFEKLREGACGEQ